MQLLLDAISRAEGVRRDRAIRARGACRVARRRDGRTNGGMGRGWEEGIQLR